MKRGITRRELLRGAALAAGMLAAGPALRRLGPGLPPIQAQTPAATASLPLAVGWNLISLPVAPGAAALPAALASIAGKYSLVYAYDALAPDQPWRHYAPARPAYTSNLAALSERMGLWVKAEQAASLTCAGATLASTNIPLRAGWNLIGYPFRQALPVATALASIAGRYDRVYAYDAADATDPWKLYGTDLPPVSNDLVEMQPGRGYWVHATRDCTLTLPPTLVTTPRVVHVHAPSATHWNYSTGYYGDAVEAAVVDGMVARGLMELTGTASVAAAWGLLLPAYEPGQKIAIKINLNNATCGDGDNVIDALAEPLEALIATLVDAGIRADDIWVYDAIREMPGRIYANRRFAAARYYAANCADARATFNKVDPSLRVTFNHPAMLSERWLTDILYQATYLINLPIMKKHGTHPVTLGFKNHFGSLNRLGGWADDDPHIYINPNDGRYRSDFSPLVDINANPNIAQKTVLTLGDGLYGAQWVNSTPQRWETFGNQSPNSLFFARDRVAIDCVMMDFLRAEWGLDERGYDYLRLAEQRALGTFERGDPWGAGYGRIDYRKLTL